MQELWAKVLAGEANAPGRYSKRTVNFLGSLDKSDAIQFTTLCGFGWIIGNSFDPLIYEIDGSIYMENSITFGEVKHMNDIGLLGFIPELAEYKKMKIPKKITFYYYNTSIIVEFMNEENNELEIGKVLLSKIGKELAQICDSKPIPGFLDYVIKRWLDKGLILSSPYPS